MTDAADLVLLGVFGAAHGVRGEIRLKSWTGDPMAIAGYGPLSTEDGRHFEIIAARPQKDMLVVRVKGIMDRNAAERLVNLKLFVPRAKLGTVEEEDSFFQADLVGLKVETPDGDMLGTITVIHNFGAGDLLEIKPPVGGQTRLLPFTKAVVPVVDVKGGRVVALPPVEVGDKNEEAAAGEPEPPRPIGAGIRRGRA